MSRAKLAYCPLAGCIAEMPADYDPALVTIDDLVQDESMGRIDDTDEYRVEGGDTPEDYDHGTIVGIEGDMVTVAWVQSLETTSQRADALRPYQGSTEAMRAAEEVQS